MGLAMRKTFSGRHRERNGRAQRATTDAARTEEREADVLAIAINQPHRRGHSDPRSPVHGHALGRLRHSGVIDGSQYTALQWAARAMLRYMRHVLGVPMPRFPSILAREVVDEGPGAAEPPQSLDLGELAADMAMVDEALATGANLGHCEARSIIFRVCVMDQDWLTDSEAGALRTAGNRLARALEIRGGN